MFNLQIFLYICSAKSSYLRRNPLIYRKIIHSKPLLWCLVIERAIKLSPLELGFAHLTQRRCYLLILNFFKMQNQEKIVIQSNNSKLMLQVMDDLTVQLYTNPNFDFLMDTATVANGYGVSHSTIKSNKYNHRDELKEGVHYVVASAVQNLDSTIKHNALLWTKAGVIRLGFFIKSERAKAFRDWAESIVLQASAPMKNLPAIAKRNHNRITPVRMVGILADVAKIEDSKLRLSLIEKLGVC